MIITCPHCQTKYQVAFEAIGAVGRKVQCAHCNGAWQQRPVVPEAPAENSAASDAMDEDALDEVMEAEARKAMAETQPTAEQERSSTDSGRQEAAKVDPALINKRQKDFSKRQTAIAAELPLARLRRSLRLVGVVMLAAILVVAYWGRVEVVTRFPSMAGVYEAVGLGVNVVGLEFDRVTTLRTIQNGKDTLVVSAQIVGIEPEPVPVPPVVVTLLDDHGQPIYQWSAAPSVKGLQAGERTSFDTQLTLPPGNASRVRLSFDGGQVPPESLEALSQARGEGPAATDHAQAPPQPAVAEPDLHPSPEHH